VCLARLSGDMHHSLCHICDILYDMPDPHGPRGVLWKSLALQAEPFAGESVAKHDVLL
jgi:hypothetical protein